MATSGSYDYIVTAAQIIQGAFEDLMVVIPGGTVNAADGTLALQRLNLIAKQWQGRSDLKQGLKIWSRQRIVMYLEQGQQHYSLGLGGAAKAALQGHAGFTTLSAAEAASQTTISITSNTDTTSMPGSTVTMANTNVVGIVLDTGAIHWTTISGTPASTMTIANALPSGAAAGNQVYWYVASSVVGRLIHLEAAVLRNEDRTDQPLSVYTTVQDYELGVTDKYGDGSPSILLFEPGLLTTRITLDSQPSDGTEFLILTGLYPSEDYDSSANDIAFPQEYFSALQLELAYRMAPAYGAEWTTQLESARQTAIVQAAQVNPENSSTYFMPDRDV